MMASMRRISSGFRLSTSLATPPEESPSPTPARSFYPAKAHGRISWLRDATGGHAFRPANKKVDQSPDEMRKEYHQHPGYFLAIAQALVGNGVDEHPNPENESRESKEPGKQQE